MAQALRELAPDITDVSLGTAEGPEGEPIPMIWPADNIRDVLHRAADLIDELTIKAGEAA